MPEVKELRLALFWRMLAARLDTPDMQRSTGAVGRVWPVHLAPPGTPPGASDAHRWGKVLIVPVTNGFSMEQTSDLMRLVRFRVTGIVNDWAPPEGSTTTYDPMVPLEHMQAVAYRLLHRWRPTDPQGYLRIALPMYREEEPAAAPFPDQEQGTHELSSLYAFQAAPVKVTVP